LEAEATTKLTRDCRIFEVTLKPEKDKSIVSDTSFVYVRGEENLDGWRPRGVSLISEHQAQASIYFFSFFSFFFWLLRLVEPTMVPTWIFGAA